MLISSFLRDKEFALEGDNVTLSCNYSGSVRGLHWYQQYAGSPPKFLILDYYGAVTKADPPVAGVSIHHRKYNSSVDLKISSAAVTDSALYYCALDRGVGFGVKPVLITRAQKEERALEKSGIYFILPGFFHFLIKFR
uniref:T-cell receptor alpha/delta variable 24.0.4 n=1 Tax=Cyprinus carpio TaxID=7962 RepID=A0A8C1N5L8_CYPCA